MVKNKRTFQAGAASRELLEQIIQAQKEHINNLEYERDLLAKGYRVTVARCDELEAIAQKNGTRTQSE